VGCQHANSDKLLDDGVWRRGRSVGHYVSIRKKDSVYLSCMYSKNDREEK
jgi:hypothetical protein